MECGETPDLPNAVLHDIGFSIAAYPPSLMAAAMQAMVETWRGMKGDARPGSMDFSDLRRRIGFDEYYETSERYITTRRDRNGQ